jgi:MFS family permease
MDEATKAIPMLVATAAALVCFIPLGILSGKLGRKNTVMLGLGVLTLAAVIACFATNIVILYMLFALIGISWAAINVNSYPMVVEMAKGADIGRYTGYYYTFQMAAQIATPLLSGLLIDLVDNYVGKGKGMNILFPYAVVFLVFAVVAMIFVRHGDSKDSDIKAEQLMAQDTQSVDEVN